MCSQFTRSFRRVATILLAASLFAVGGAHAAEKANIGTVVWIGYGPYYVAAAKDMFKKSGVKVSLQFFTDPALIPPAIEGGADYLVTGDKRDLLSLGKIETVQIITARAFADLLGLTAAD